MKEIDFSWFYKQTKDKRTISLLKRIESKECLKQKFPLKIGKLKLWLGDNPSNSLKTFLQLFKEKDHNMIPNFLSKSDLTIIDLGANEGFYTLKAKELSPKSKIISVEPNPYAFRTLKSNVKYNRLKNVITVNKAVTSKNGKITFEIVKGKSTVGSTKVYEKYRIAYEIEKIRINSITLECLCKKFKIDKIDLLKMDVEGSELDILKSSEKILSKVKKAIIEYHRAQRTRRGVTNLMIKNNFKLLKVDDQKYYGDLYFIRNA